MALPRQHFQQEHYHTQQQPPPQSYKPSRNLCAIEGQISPDVPCCNPCDLLDESRHPPYIPPVHVSGLAPSLVTAAANGSDTRADWRWNYGLGSKKKRLKELDFLESSSQISSVDFLQPRSVSTGLGLSLDNTLNTCTEDSPLLSLMGDDIDGELQQQDAEIDRLLKVQGENLRRNIVEKVHATHLQTVSFAEEKVIQKLREKEAEVEIINKKNIELEEQVEQLTTEAGTWQQRAKYNESTISALEYNLHRVYAQSRDSKEGCGDSEVDDTASCGNGHPDDFHQIYKDNSDMDIMACKACRINQTCMLLLPCKHLCLCRECESKLSFCPLCHSSKFIGMEVYM